MLCETVMVASGWMHWLETGWKSELFTCTSDRTENDLIMFSSKAYYTFGVEKCVAHYMYGNIRYVSILGGSLPQHCIEMFATTKCVHGDFWTLSLTTLYTVLLRPQRRTL